MSNPYCWRISKIVFGDLLSVFVRKSSLISASLSLDTVLIAFGIGDPLK
jgi:hypothetical protein